MDEALKTLMTEWRVMKREVDFSTLRHSVSMYLRMRAPDGGMQSLRCSPSTADMWCINLRTPFFS